MEQHWEVERANCLVILDGLAQLDGYFSGARCPAPLVLVPLTPFVWEAFVPSLGIDGALHLAFCQKQKPNLF